MDTIIQSTAKDLEEVCDFYQSVIKALEGAVYSPAWQWGLYPMREDIEKAVRAGTLFTLRRDGQIIGAFVLNQECPQGYEQAEWQVEANPDQVYYLHLLVVHPELQRQGLSRKLLDFIQDEARKHEARAIRLDVMDGNLAASRAYEKYGFSFRAKTPIYYEDTGWKDFYLFELGLA